MGIIFIDEVDKISAAADSGYHRDVGGLSVQQALLKMLEGTTITIVERSGCEKVAYELDTSIFSSLRCVAGPFSQLEEVIANRLNVIYFEIS